ncbi:MAG: ferrous iron transporter B [Elusimicrobia bacterium]|nr:ferrous iron transporter B [Elusimicrobiota bacterium]
MKRVVALAGRPNTGKTTLFNALTGLRHRAANYAGCTVEKAIGTMQASGGEVEVVDLPGTFSMLPQTEDEQVAFRFLSECAGSGDDLLVLCVAEASNLDNDLVLPAGLKAAGYPVALAVNMIDESRLNGIKLDAAELSGRLGMPVALVSARTREGLEKLDALLTPPALRADLSEAMDFRRATKKRLHELQDEAVETARTASAASVTWPHRSVLPTVARAIRIDRVLLHPVAGPVILAVTMFLLFQALFVGARPVMDFLAAMLGSVAVRLRAHLPEGAVASLLCDGAIPGISAVVVFVPQIAILFLMIGFLEQSGYLPRAGAMVDRALRPFGLDGRVFIPFLSGFACAIPGVMAARTIHSEKRRIVTILLTPLMTCSARIPVYTLLITAFVPLSFRPLGFNGQGVVMAGMYVFGIVMALLLALALKFTSLHELHPAPATVLPPYRVPSARELARYVWARCWHFLSRAGQVIFTLSLVLWALAAFPRDAARLAPIEAELAAARTSAPSDPGLERALRGRLAAARIEGSVLGRTGRLIEPVFEPLGWDWRVSIASLSALAAREVFVGTLGTIYALGGESNASDGLVVALQDAKNADGTKRYGLATAVSLLIFFAIALQCMSTIVTVRRETNSWKIPALQFAFLFGLAYALSFAGYRLTLAFLG